jgi:hypothetical protein
VKAKFTNQQVGGDNEIEEYSWQEVSQRLSSAKIIIK